MHSTTESLLPQAQLFLLEKITIFKNTKNSPLFTQVGQVLIYNCDLAKMKQSSATQTTQSYTWGNTNLQSITQ